MALDPTVEAEVAALAARYGHPRRLHVALDGPPFSPFLEPDRYGEVCMVVRRPSGLLLTAIKTFYPAGAFRLLTGGIGHGEPIETALLRETAEETGLDVRVARFLAVIEYTLGDASFVTFAFLLEELGGTLGVADESEQIAAFREVRVDELPKLAATLDRLPDVRHDKIEGRWSGWGRFRAMVHRAVYDVLRAP